MMIKAAIWFATNVFDVTLSPNFKIGNLTIIPELRFDNAKDKIFTDMMAIQPKQHLQEYLQQLIIFKIIVHHLITNNIQLSCDYLKPNNGYINPNISKQSKKSID